LGGLLREREGERGNVERKSIILIKCKKKSEKIKMTSENKIIMDFILTFSLK
jgi:hypothetical protein